MFIKPKIAIIGVGSIIFFDDGVGVYACKYLDENYTFLDEVSLIDGGVLGFGLLDYMQEYDKVLILDTITMDDEAGAIYNLPSEMLLGLGSYKQSVHEIEVVEMLESCVLLDKCAQVNIIAIVPEDIVRVNIGLSDILKEKFETFVEVVLSELKSTGVGYEKKKTQVSLEYVLQFYDRSLIAISNSAL
jgi:hydrogenase maturation protease